MASSATVRRRREPLARAPARSPAGGRLPGTRPEDVARTRSSSLPVFVVSGQPAVVRSFAPGPGARRPCAPNASNDDRPPNAGGRAPNVNQALLQARLTDMNGRWRAAGPSVTAGRDGRG